MIVAGPAKPRHQAMLTIALTCTDRIALAQLFTAMEVAQIILDGPPLATIAELIGEN